MNYLKELAYLSVKSTFRWNIVFIPGLILSLVTLIMAVVAIFGIVAETVVGDQLFLTMGSEMFSILLKGSGRAITHVGAVGFIVPLVGAGMVMFSIPIGIAVTSLYMIRKYYMLATRYTTHKALYDMWRTTLKDWFTEQLTRYLNSVIDNSKNLSKDNQALTQKMQLLLAIKEDENANIFQKGLLSFVVKIIDLEERDIYDSTLKFSDVVIEKVHTFMDFLINPSFLFVYLTHALHLWVITMFIPI